MVKLGPGAATPRGFFFWVFTDLREVLVMAGHDAIGWAAPLPAIP